MRIGVVSDIHSNLDALERVLAVMQPVDQVWCLGDTVGYGPQPNECVARLAELAKHLAVAGNHDWAAIGKMGIQDFNPYAALAARWTMEQLRTETRDYLLQLPSLVTSGEFTLAHGSPRNPIWEYLLSAAGAEASFAHFEGPFCLVGHTHIPSLFMRAEDGQVVVRRIVDEAEVELAQPGCRFILNPGSVGQPRDDDPRAAFMIVDTDRRSATWRRISYPIKRTQDKMRRAKLPAKLIDRLSKGW
ncbi:MAG TPA: metallophosphoesterase family protein [Chloroflexota bacterium]|nr:metallophosphoesterase family protein [Chloroflexota bacterium]